jgi:hypothetical protein
MLASLERPVQVFAVWEPLSASAVPPSQTVLAALQGPRVQQLWDPGRLLSLEVRRAELAHPGAIPSARLRTDAREDGILYDTVVLYEEGAVWEDTLPPPTWLDGGLAAVLPALRERLAERAGLSEP